MSTNSSKMHVGLILANSALFTVIVEKSEKILSQSHKVTDRAENELDLSLDWAFRLNY